MQDKVKNVIKTIKKKQVDGAKEAFMQELFNDYYENRKKIYKMNFIRGLFFGLGSVLGGTVVIALAVWTLSLFVDFPLIGEYLQQTQDALQQTQE